ncbi:MAG TPA: S-adenosylmethionine:tRNA ribosyltransferase-isomerase [Chitinophagales bacterium]|nr:S-adenosylmethionine:tRNA ribosyltransferase-isomerase [Chitinophagales bacterium]
MRPKDLSIADFAYVLPPERIAQFPLEERDQSKLLIYDDGKISEDIFSNITEHLPENSLLVFNDTKVIHARIVFKNANDASVEIFLLDPIEPTRNMQLAIFTHETCVWRCFIGNVKKWREEFLFKKIKIGEEKVLLEVWLKGKIDDDFLVEFKWDHGEFSFAQILAAGGFVPLPPYIKRKSEEEDESRYQTVYAVQDGSVAAPTAGLHFTESLFKKLKEKKIQSEFVTLHVSAGTFLPVKSQHIGEHHMHAEQIVVRKETIQKLLDTCASSPLVCVGTTSLRTIESLHWFAKKISERNESLSVSQWGPYDNNDSSFTIHHSLFTILDFMEKKKLNQLTAETKLLIAPGYDFKFADGLITNFHLPNSTLLLLIAAFIGDDWRKVYDYALQNDFRFLSYGDGSLLWKKTSEVFFQTSEVFGGG